MPKYRQSDGSVIDLNLSDLVNDDGSPFNVDVPATLPPGGPFFTQEQVDAAREAARKEEKDKLYTRIDGLGTEIKSFKDRVETLTTAEEARKQEAEAEKARLEAEARATEEKELDAKTLIERRTAEWQTQLSQTEQQWEQRLGEEQARREAAEALAAREREFSDLKEYTQAQVTAHKDEIAPQLLNWITGNTKEEIDSAITRAISTSNDIATEVQQRLNPNPDLTQQQQQTVPFYTPGVPQVPAPPVTPGTRSTGMPGNTDPGAQFQQLTAEQIKNMPMAEYAKIRGPLGVGGGSSNNRGLYG